MSLSKEYTKYYLTDEGWINVYSRTDFTDEKQDNPVPEKYYMICTYREEQSSPYSEMCKDTNIEFEDSNKKEEIQELIRKYGTCPRRL
jgi:ribosomal 30S subunit maturation factor RimM